MKKAVLLHRFLTLVNEKKRTINPKLFTKNENYV